MTRRQRLQQTLVAIESIPGPIAGRGVHPHIGDVVEPPPPLLIEIGIIGKRPSVDEIAAETDLQFTTGA